METFTEHDYLELKKALDDAACNIWCCEKTPGGENHLAISSRRDDKLWWRWLDRMHKARIANIMAEKHSIQFKNYKHLERALFRIGEKHPVKNTSDLENEIRGLYSDGKDLWISSPYSFNKNSKKAKQEKKNDSGYAIKYLVKRIGKLSKENSELKADIETWIKTNNELASSLEFEKRKAEVQAYSANANKPKRDPK